MFIHRSAHTVSLTYFAQPVICGNKSEEMKVCGGRLARLGEWTRSPAGAKGGRGAEGWSAWVWELGVCLEAPPVFQGNSCSSPHLSLPLLVVIDSVLGDKETEASMVCVQTLTLAHLLQWVWEVVWFLTKWQRTFLWGALGNLFFWNLKCNLSELANGRCYDCFSPRPELFHH